MMRFWRQLLINLRENLAHTWRDRRGLRWYNRSSTVAYPCKCSCRWAAFCSEICESSGMKGKRLSSRRVSVYSSSSSWVEVNSNHAHHANVLGLRSWPVISSRGFWISSWERGKLECKRQPTAFQKRMTWLSNCSQSRHTASCWKLLTIEALFTIPLNEGNAKCHVFHWDAFSIRLFPVRFVYAVHFSREPASCASCHSFAQCRGSVCALC